MAKITDIGTARKVAELAKRFGESGWWMPRAPVVDGALNGPTLYLCDFDTGRLYAVALVENGIERTLAAARQSGVSFDDACDLLSSVLRDVSSGKEPLDASSRAVLALMAAIYIGGTQSYRLSVDTGLPNPHFVIVHYKDESDPKGGHLLRPATVNTQGPITPAEIETLVNQLLAWDRVKHPERFPRATVLKFQIRSEEKL